MNIIEIRIKTCWRESDSLWQLGIGGLIGFFLIGFYLRIR
jgi:hypothetical protein